MVHYSRSALGRFAKGDSNLFRYVKMPFPAAVLCGACFLAAPAQAQSSVSPYAMAQVPKQNPVSEQAESGALPEGMGVMDRTRPEYNAAGIPVGSFRLYPTLAAGFSADDNIFRATDATSDTFWTLSPRLDLRSGWLNDSLQLYAQLDHYAYNDNDKESHTNWIVGGAGKVGLAEGSYLSGDAYYYDTHESRISPDLSEAALSPTRYRRAHADATGLVTFNRLALSTTFDYDRYDFDDTKLFGGGFIDNGDRNRDVYQVTGKASYELAPNQAIFAQVTYDKRNFDRMLDRNGEDRTSDGYRVDAGAAMMVTPLVQATAYVGYLQQNYAAPLKDASGFDFNAQVDWFATQLLTLHLTASRTIEDTTIAGASSVDVRAVGASADYELLRNFILQPHVEYSDNKFDGISRDDKITSAGLEARYLMNEYLSAYAGYEYQHRASDAVGRKFSDNLFTIGVRGQY
ncbi:MAG TPA: outer membrane beta-barrel protein [Rhizomicrobium sp.]|nr:outer membrane beta-barrel protein [Rhizomicrobium sp.]